MKKRVIKVFTKIFTAVLLTVLLAVLFFNISTRIAVGKIKRGGSVNSGYAAAVIVSGSMKPAVSVDDLLIIKGEKSYNIGDIVTYLSENGSLITHRIKEVTKDGYIMQGDANNTPDDEVSQKRLIGKAVVILPLAGIIVRRFFSPLSVILISCIVLLVWLIIRFARKLNFVQF